MTSIVYPQVSRKRTREPDYYAPDGGLLSGETFGGAKRMRMYRRYRPRTAVRRRRRGRRAYRRRMPLSNTVPRTKLVKFKVLTRGYITGVSGAIGVALFQANGLSDPTQSASANLPLGLDQWAGFYDRYTVVGSHCYIQMHQTTDLGAAHLTLNVREDINTLSSTEHYAESPNTVQKIMSSDVDRDSLKLGWSLKRHQRIKNVLDAEDYEGVLSTTPGDPTRNSYFHFAVQDVSGNQSVTIEYVATVSYVVLLHDRKNLARSSL